MPTNEFSVSEVLPVLHHLYSVINERPPGDPSVAQAKAMELALLKKLAAYFGVDDPAN